MRTVPEIAHEISRTWKNVHYAAAPYLRVMRSGDYGYDDPTSVVLYFLANAQAFRGPDAQRLKAELRQHLPNRKGS